MLPSEGNYAKLMGERAALPLPLFDTSRLSRIMLFFLSLLDRERVATSLKMSDTSAFYTTAKSRGAIGFARPKAKERQQPLRKGLWVFPDPHLLWVPFGSARIIILL